MELLTFSASDGVELHGWLQLPAKCERALAVDAMVFLHGAGSNFYSSSLLRGLAPALLNAGVAILAINTRGHDLVTTLKTPQGGKRGGAAFEIVDECRHDVRGAVESLVSRGFRNVALVGHSLGAIKAVYSQARSPNESVKFVVALGPPRLSYSAFAAGPRGQEFREIIASAEARVAAGKPHDLLEVTLPLPLLISAAGYLDKYGTGERYNILNFAGESPCPTLVTYGAAELTADNGAFARLDTAIRNLAATSSTPVDVEVISAADHFYSGCAARLTKTLLAWPRWLVEGDSIGDCRDR